MQRSATAKAGMLLGLLFAVAGDAQAQQDPAFGLGPGSRPKRVMPCMDDREQKAEALIRTGIIMREIGRECQRRRVDMSLLPAWQAFDQANAEQIQAAARLRGDALVRNYPDVPDIALRLDSRLIASTGLQRMADEECHVVRRLLNGFTEYNDLVIHAQRTELGRVKNTYPKCRTRNDRGDR